MDITKVSAISPILTINSFKSKEAKTDSKKREEKKGKGSEKELNLKTRRDSYDTKN